MASDESAALTYASYLALDDVLGAQRPRSGEHDELLSTLRSVAPLSASAEPTAPARRPSRISWGSSATLPPETSAAWAAQTPAKQSAWSSSRTEPELSPRRAAIAWREHEVVDAGSDDLDAIRIGTVEAHELCFFLRG